MQGKIVMPVTGRLWKTDAQGYILNDANSIQPTFMSVVADAVAAYTRAVAADLHSIYVTGSVARGLAVEGMSDLNICAVLDEQTDPELALRDWTPAAEEAILDQHAVISDVRLELWPYTTVLGDPAFFSIGAFILKTQSICLWGGDLTPELPDYRITPHIANDDIVNLADDVQDARNDLEANPTPRRTRAVCYRVAKQLLHTGFSLVMLRTGVYTRDLDLSCDYVVQHYPDHADDARRALAYVRQPSREAQVVRDYLNRFGVWMVSEANRWLDQHNPARDLAMPTNEVEGD
jgi:hypothetical protein